MASRGLNRKPAPAASQCGLSGRTITENLITENDLTVEGSISAYKIESALSQSITIESSGSTKFGDDTNDKHSITGSLSMTGSFNLNGYTVNEISNDQNLSDNRSDSIITEYAGKQFFGETQNLILKVLKHLLNLSN